jgi:CDP-glycerol glycerophosphotransferase (TagB/SpsB family)
MKTIFIAIAFGTSVRDVLRNDTFLKLKERKDLRVVILAPQVCDPQFVKEFSGENIEFEQLVKFKSTIVERILFAFHRAALRDKCTTIDLGNWSGDTKGTDLFTPFARTAIKLLGDRGVLKMIHLGYRKFTRATMYEDIFDKYNPDLVVVTRVLNYSMDYPVLRMAAKKDVPVVSLISSWDNLTSKGFFPFSIKSLVVWNSILKEEAMDLFFFPKEKISICGIPRYDLFFQRKGLENRKAFFKKFNLNPAKKLIMYGTGSPTIGVTKIDLITPEPELVEFIADEIQNGKINQEVQLLIRLHPQANPDHYKRLIERNDVIVHIPGRNVSFHDRLFSKNDDIEYAESLLHSDLIINYGSTVTIDAAVFDTPIICVNFDFRGKRPYKYSMTRIYDFDHYKKLVEIGGFKLSSSRDELIQNINEYLSNPTLDEDGRRKIVKKQCHFTDGKSGERIAKHILDLLYLEESKKEELELMSSNE